MEHTRQSIRSGILLALVLLLHPIAAIPYEKDSHYYLRFTLSLATCFNWEEAHIIASGDWGMDENASTHAEMNPVQKSNKIDWHAFGHSDARFNELWLRTVNEPDLELRLVRLGQFMHFLEDWEAHAGYGLRMGHARHTYTGRDPDSLGNSRAKNHRMVQSALDHLLASCEDLGRLENDPDEELAVLMQMIFADELLTDLHEASDPGWKRGTLGGLRATGKQVQDKNKARLEVFIEENIAQLPGKGVPEDFAAGTGQGIPPSLRIPFEQDGAIADIRTDLEVVRDTATAEHPADVAISIDKAEMFSRRRGGKPTAGWRVQLQAVNIGESVSNAGHVEIAVIDSEDESLVAQATEPLPALQPGETKALELTIVTRNQPESDVIIGAFARVQDLSASNDEDWLMLGDAEEEEPQTPDVYDVDPQPMSTESIRFLAPPKTFVFDSSACIVVTALVSGGDSTEKLDVGAVQLVGGALDEHPSRRTIPNRWSAVSTDVGLVGAKTVACFVPSRETLEILRNLDPGTLEIAVTLEADNVEPFTQVFALDPDFYQDFINLPVD